MTLVAKVGNFLNDLRVDGQPSAAVQVRDEFENLSVFSRGYAPGSISEGAVADTYFRVFVLNEPRAIFVRTRASVQNCGRAILFGRVYFERVEQP